MNNKSINSYWYQSHTIKCIMKNICIFLFILVLQTPFSNLWAQNKEFSKAHFSHDKKGLREAKKNLKKGNDFYNDGWGNYEKALEYFLEAYEFNPDNAQLNMRIGECYLYSAFRDKSIPYLEKAIELNVNTLEVYFLMGIAYQQNYMFDKAMDQFRFYRQSLSPQEIIQQKSRIDKRIRECENAMQMVQSPIRVFIDNLGEKVNSEYDDYSPVFSPNGRQMYFTTRRPLSKKAKIDEVDHKYYENIMVSHLKRDQWTDATVLPGRINSKSHDAIAGISADGNSLFVYRGEKGGDLYVSKFKNDKWSKPKRLPAPFSVKGSQETSIVFSSDGRQAFFVSERPGGYGGKDIWTSQKNEKDRWEDAVNLGSTVNTEFDEISIFLAEDDVTLYFSSQGHNSMGGMDIFKTEFRNGRWIQPENLGYPVNTPGDDMFFVLETKGEKAFYSTMTPDNLGGSDIFMITFLGPEKRQSSPTLNNLIAHHTKPLDFNLMENQVDVPVIPMTILRGKILDSQNQDPVNAIIELYDNETEELLAEFTNNIESGEYLISLPGGKNYGISVSAEDYLFHSENMKVAENEIAREIINNINLKRVEVGQSIVLNNIFFDTGSYTLSSESYVELGILIKLLTDNPSVRIEVAGHTDNVGSAAVNKRISEQRAKAVVDFLIERGIDPARLTFKGYGFDKPVASNDTEEGRQLNRRTEFEVIEK